MEASPRTKLLAAVIESMIYEFKNGGIIGGNGINDLVSC